MWLFVSKFLVQKSSIFVALHVDQVMVRSGCSCKPPTKQISFSILQLFYLKKKCNNLKGHSLKNRLFCVFQDMGSVLLQKAHSQDD